jgi:uncharacterized membrane protein YhaH (DUF805 family)
MTFFESVKTCYQKYFDWNGRASRSEYWWFHLYMVLLWLPMLLAMNGAPKNVPMPLWGVIYAFIWVGLTLIPSWMVTIRRLHDTNRTGWWYLIVNIPIVGLLLLWFLVQPSKDPNQYDLTPEKAPT